MRKPIIGVMGPGDDATAADLETAHALGQSIAEHGWVLLCGGRNVGVMDSVSRGAQAAGGLTIGVLPTDTADIASSGVDIAIVTGMGDARNNINVLTADIVVVCGMNPGTASEVALALKLKKTVILLNQSTESIAFFKTLDEKRVLPIESAPAAITEIQRLLG